MQAVSSDGQSHKSCKHAPTWANAVASLPSGPYLISLSCPSVFGELVLSVHWFKHGKVKS